MGRAIALLIGVLFSAWAHAETVRLVTGDELSPYTGKDLPQYGMLTEIVRRAFELAGKQTTLDWAPWKRGYQLARIVEYDATFPYARTSEREKDFLFSEQVYGGVRSVYAREGSGIDPARIATFHGRTYCAPIGYIVYPQIEALLSKQLIKIHRPLSMASCAKMLALERVDFFITDSISGDEIVRTVNVGSKIVRLEKAFDQAEFHLIVSKKRPDADVLLKEFNAGLKRLKSSGEYATIVMRHLQ